MIGILCGLNKENDIAPAINNAMKSLPADSQAEILVFSAPNINLMDNTACGSLIANGSVLPAKVKIPPLVLNCAQRHRRADVKTLRAVMDGENTTILNASNVFDQHAVMQMLACGQAKKFAVPFRMVGERDIPSVQADSFIIKPETGVNLAKTVYVKKDGPVYNIYSLQGGPYYRVSDPGRGLTPVMNGRNRLMLETPGLLMDNGRLIMTRAFLQLGASGVWQIIQQTPFYQTGAAEKTRADLEPASVTIAAAVNCYIHDLCLCFIDFAFTPDNDPYMINFGGWQNGLLSKDRLSTVQEKFCKNIVEYAKQYFASEGL